MQRVFFLCNLSLICAVTKVKRNMAQLLIKSIKFKYKSFHNSADWSGLCLQSSVYPFMIAKIFKIYIEFLP